ncbi:MAG TPA: VOC family protein [Phycisphaerae bacterium]
MFTSRKFKTATTPTLAPVPLHSAHVQAVDNVHLEAPPQCADDLRWFYADLVGLECVEEALAGAGSILRFRSERIELHLRLTPEPQLEPVACRAVLLVPSLAAAAERLSERKIAFVRINGIQYTDRRLSLLDPGGNRIELKQAWLYGML